MVLVQAESQHWVSVITMTLLGELRRRAPHAINWDTMDDVVPVLDAFEIAMSSHRH